MGEANVTVHVLDPVGLDTEGTTPLGPKRMRERLDSLPVIADMTGGRTVLNTNAPEAHVAAILEESAAYYVLGFTPAPPVKGETDAPYRGPRSSARCHGASAQGIHRRRAADRVGAGSGSPDARHGRGAAGAQCAARSVRGGDDSGSTARQRCSSAALAKAPHGRRRWSRRRSRRAQLRWCHDESPSHPRRLAGAPDRAPWGWCRHWHSSRARTRFAWPRNCQAAPPAASTRSSTSLTSGRRRCRCPVSCCTSRRKNRWRHGTRSTTRCRSCRRRGGRLRAQTSSRRSCRSARARLERTPCSPPRWSSESKTCATHALRNQTGTLTTAEFARHRTANVRLTLPLRELPPGQYLLTLEATSGERRAERSLRFDLR